MCWDCVTSRMSVIRSVLWEKTSPGVDSKPNRRFTMSLGFWSKSTPLTAENYRAFGKKIATGRLMGPGLDGAPDHWTLKGPCGQNGS